MRLLEYPTLAITKTTKNSNVIEQKSKYIVPVISPTKSYITRFENIDIPTQSVELIINGRSVWVFSKYLYEVSDK